MSVDVRGPRKIAVIGAGLMGAGIAELLTTSGHDVVIFDTNTGAAHKAAQRLSGRVKVAGSVSEAAIGANLVFEAVAEDEAVKHEIFREVGEAAPDAILASNTSSIPPSVLAASVPSADRFLVAHFFNPATVVPLVELVPAPQTAPATIDTVAELLTAAGKEVVVLRREIAGFVANRLQAALLREAFAIEQAGVASFDDIDRVVRSGLGSRWAAAGPFSIIDLGGLDIWHAICARLFPELATNALPPRALSERVADGALGAKTGAGIHPHDPSGVAALRARITEHFALEFPAPRA